MVILCSQSKLVHHFKNQISPIRKLNLMGGGQARENMTIGKNRKVVVMTWDFLFSLPSLHVFFFCFPLILSIFLFLFRLLTLVVFFLSFYNPNSTFMANITWSFKSCPCSLKFLMMITVTIWKQKPSNLTKWEHVDLYFRSVWSLSCLCLPLFFPFICIQQCSNLNYTVQSRCWMKIKDNTLGMSLELLIPILFIILKMY